MTAVWQLEANTALLADSTISGRIDLARPHEGVALELPGSVALRSLGVVFGAATSWDPDRIEAYVRGVDLVATYGETPPHNLRAQIYWRRLTGRQFAPSDTAEVVAAFDLIVSVNTSLLDADPQASICAHLPAESDFLILNASLTGFNSISLAGPQAPTSSGVAGCLLTRLPGGTFTYVEMIHPRDFNRSTLIVSPAQSALQVSHHLFQQRLEKGVILRARLRAAVLARTDDAAVALTAYQQFAASEPPLTA